MIAEVDELGQWVFVACLPPGVGGPARGRHLRVSCLQRASKSGFLGLIEKAHLRAPVNFGPIDASNGVFRQLTELDRSREHAGQRE